VVRKVIRSNATEFPYERESQPTPKMGLWLDRLEGGSRETRGSRRASGRRWSGKFEEPHRLGYGGGYDAVRRRGANWREQRGATSAQAYVPLTFAPGEAYQFDWSHEIILMDAVTTTVKVAHVRLCHSRMMFLRAYPRETQEMAFDAHERAFAFFKGVKSRPNSRSSRASSVTSSASGHATPPAAARFRLSWIVERATPRRRPISRAFTPSW
jgi:hypothetical protein